MIVQKVTVAAYTVGLRNHRAVACHCGAGGQLFILPTDRCADSIVATLLTAIGLPLR